LFKISDVIIRDVVVYKVKDLLDEELQGVFYEKELQAVYKEDAIYDLNILKQKKTKNGIMYYVNWKGYPKKFNQWIHQKDLQ
jgi:glutaredoxin-related protein